MRIRWQLHRQRGSPVQRLFGARSEERDDAYFGFEVREPFGFRFDVSRITDETTALIQISKSDHIQIYQDPDLLLPNLPRESMEVRQEDDK